MVPTVPDEVAAALAARYGVRTGALERLGGGEPWSDGVRYRLPGRPPAILKVQAAATTDLAARLAAAERLSMAMALTADGAPLPSILPSVRGHLLETVDHGAASYWAYAMRHIAGEPLGQVPREARTAHLVRLGRSLGRMHRSSQRLTVWRGSPTVIDGAPILHWHVEWQDMAEQCRDDPEVAAVWHNMAAELARLPSDRDGFGFVHNDPHLHNVLVDGDRLMVVDLDVATYHWFAADLATALFSITTEGRDQDPLAHEQVDRFLSGYLAVHPLEGRWLATVPTFLRYRRALLLLALGNDLPIGVRRRWRAEVVADGAVLPWMPAHTEAS